MSSIDSDELAAAIQTLAGAIAAAVVRELRQPGEDQWVSQADSPLGSRLHCRAVRRRVNAGDPGAAIVRRKHLLSNQALAEELRRQPAQKRKSSRPGAGAGKAESSVENLRQRLRAVGADI